MTDNEIIKAFDILDRFAFFQGQRAGRELWGEKPFDIQEEDLKKFSDDVDFLKDFFSRQKAEIDRLKNLNIKLDEYIVRARAEAVKEFAERLKAEMIKSRYSLNVSPYARACNAVVDFWVDEIDNLVKEFTEGG